MLGIRRNAVMASIIAETDAASWLALSLRPPAPALEDREVQYTFGHLV